MLFLFAPMADLSCEQVMKYNMKNVLAIFISTDKPGLTRLTKVNQKLHYINKKMS